MSCDGFTTNSIWEAAVLVYLYGWDSLTQIEDEADGRSRKRMTTYSVAVPSEDAKLIITDYESEAGLPLASAKAFVHAFNLVSQAQKAMRQRGESSWCSSRWIAGKVR
jgi:hypothetical protein